LRKLGLYIGFDREGAGSKSRGRADQLDTSSVSHSTSHSAITLSQASSIGFSVTNRN
jgi:hypothetical protein